MPDRFFAPNLPAKGSIELTGSEAHHLLHVLRLSHGDAVELFDGRGHEADARVVSLARQSATLEITARRSRPDEADWPLVLAVAVPKGDHFRWLVEKATELGVLRLVPLLAQRSVVSPGETKIEKLRQTVIAACKQSGRSRLMEIDDPVAWDAFLDRHVKGAPAGTVLAADRSGAAIEGVVDRSSRATPTLAIVGPEGGLTEAELSAAIEAGATPVNLGPWILRVETAAVALAAWFAVRRGG